MIKPSVISRMIAVLLFGLVMGISLYQRDTKIEALGRDDFLKRAADDYDRHHANPVPPATTIARGVAEGAVVIGIYELAAFGILKLLQLFGKKDRRGERRPRH